MPHFQGSGFSVELPDGSADASAYTFLLPMPKNAPMAPFITIQAEVQNEGSLEAHVKSFHLELQKDLENFTVRDFKAGRNAGTDVVLTTIEWGPAAARVSQTQAYYLVTGAEKPKIYALKGTDLTENFPNSQPLFNGVMRSFMPNDMQVLAETV